MTSQRLASITIWLWIAAAPFYVVSAMGDSVVFRLSKSTAALLVSIAGLTAIKPIFDASKKQVPNVKVKRENRSASSEPTSPK